MGRVYKQSYWVVGSDGKKERRESEWYYITWTDARGKTARRKAAPTKALALEILRDVEAKVARQKAGLPVQNAIDVFLTDLRGKYLNAQKAQVVPRHLKVLRHQIDEVLCHVKVLRVSDLTPERMEDFLSSLEEARVDEEGNMTAPLCARTVNGYLQAMKGMLNWAVRARILPFNPLAWVRARPSKGKSQIRRPPTETEFTRLLSVALDGPTVRQLVQRHGIRLPESPSERMKHLDEIRRRFLNGQFVLPADELREATTRGKRNCLIYRLLAYTGLRLGELAALRWTDLDLASGTLTVRAETSKNRRASTLPLHDGLIDVLKTWKTISNVLGAAPVAKIPATFLKTFDSDLEIAGIEKTDASGRTLVLHSLRHFYGSMLIKAGVDIKTVQTLMRHATPSITLGIYTHTDTKRQREAIQSLPNLTPEIASDSQAGNAPGKAS